jgi:hypothetical protein
MRSLIGIGLIGLLLGAFGHPERAVSTTRKVGELATERTFASATPYDGGFLVAWEDGRLGPPNLALAARQSTVYASRVTTQGTTLDPSGLRVSTAPFDQSDPVPSCIDVQCIVAWQQSTSGVWVRAYNAATNIWGPEATLGAAQNNWGTPKVAPIGDRFIVVWRAPSGGVEGRFLAADGTPEPTQLALVSSGSPEGPSVASNGTTFMVAWNNFTTHRAVAQVFSAAGTPVAAPVLASSSDCGPVAAAVGSTYVVVWCDALGRLTAMQVADTGGALSGATQPLGPTRGRSAVTVLADGSDFVVGWVESLSLRDIHGARLNATTLAVVSPDLVLRTENSFPSMLRFSAAGRGQALATWSVEGDPNQLGSSLLQVTDGGVLMLDAGFVSQQRPDVHIGPRVARLGSGFVTAWSSVVDKGGVPMARAVDAIGQPVATPVVLDPSALAVFGVDVSYDSTATWVAWATEAEVKVAQLNSSGQPLAVVVAGSADELFSPHLAHRGAQTLLTWAWYLHGAGTSGISGQVFDAQGRRDGAAFTLTTTNSLPQHALAASATQFGFAWATPPPTTICTSRPSRPMVVLPRRRSAPSPRELTGSPSLRTAPTLF